VIRYPAPERVLLDTSLVIASLYPGTANSNAAIAFSVELRRTGSVVCFSNVLRIEIARAMRRLATKPGNLPSRVWDEYDFNLWGTHPLIRQRWLSNGVRRFNVYISQFSTVIELQMTTSIWLESIDLMAAETLDASDAIHIASARTYGIGHFCTTDADFRRISWPAVHLIRD
jgi:predicted nucleic acid-binding protein